MTTWSDHVVKVGNDIKQLDREPDNPEDYRREIEPWLTAVIQSENLAVLVGSGLTIGVCRAASVKAAQMCRQVFERIAREGRKFGLGLVLSSQRPSELSPTVLAQCNTFLLHRLVNDRDQELVGKLVPGSLGGLLRDLPNLPTRQTILLGWATPVPVLVEMRELPEAQQPQSADPRFWDTWTGARKRSVDWQHIATEWTSS